MKGLQKVLMYILFFACFSIVISAFIASLIRWQRKEVNKNVEGKMRQWKSVVMQEVEALFMRLTAEDSFRRSQESQSEE